MPQDSGSSSRELALYTSRYRKLDMSSRYRFKCIRCDLCCGTGPNIALTVFDVVRMARFLRMDWRSFIRAYTKIVVADIHPFLILRGDEKGRCLFLAYREDGTTVCTIYPARPMRCRLYPIIIEGLRGNRGLYLDTACPGIGQGGETRVDINAVEAYRSERRKHYELLSNLILREGYEPVQALEKALDRVWNEWSDREDY